MRRVFSVFAFSLAGAILASGPAMGQTAESRHRFPNSVLAVPENPDPKAPRQGSIRRRALLAAESAAPIRFEVALSMRHFEELQVRLARGERMDRQEMEARYYPLAASHDRLVAWLKSQGLAVIRTDSNRLAVFGRGAVSSVAAAFQTTFARVALGGQEYTSAVSAPSVPEEIAAPLAGIHGLQPHLRPRHLARIVALQADAASPAPYSPSQIAAAYHANGLGLTGAGQTIAIFAYTYPSPADLTSFWTKTHTAGALSQIQDLDVDGGPNSATNQDPSMVTVDAIEAALDVEWASALAPGAAIRVYGSNPYDSTAYDETYQQVFADATNPAIHGLHQFSISLGLTEDQMEQDYAVILSQYLANLATVGVTVFAASGDRGANAAADGSLAVSSPASDPNVTAVGGTSLFLDTNGNVTGETAWAGSGGGLSRFMSRPSWQVGTGIAAGTARLVPDVSAGGDPNTGAVVWQGGISQQIGGTSWGTPTWAAFCALINESRAAAGLEPVGPLNAKLYPLIGTAAFRDIISGSNGYPAGVGYDLVTGLGVPNLSALIQGLPGAAGNPPAVLVLAQSADRTETLGQPAVFTVSASGAAPLGFHWQRLAAGPGTSWTGLSDGGSYAGTATGALSVTATTYAMNGDQFRCLVSSLSGNSLSAAQSLFINPVGVSTLAGWPGLPGRADGTGLAARFDFPNMLTLDAAGNLYVVDVSNHALRKVTPAGSVSTLAGALGQRGRLDGTGPAARFNNPAGIAIDALGNLYLADSGNCQIRRVTPAGVVTTVAGAGTQGRADGPANTAQFFDPEAVAIDAAGNLYVADGRGNTIRKVSAAGVVSTLAGSAAKGSADGPALSAQFNTPTALTVDAAGVVYISDSSNNTVRKLAAGIVTTLAGSAASIGSADGSGTAARFNLTAGIHIDGHGTLYLADQSNGTLRLIDSVTGQVSTWIGHPGSVQTADGLATNARFGQLTDLAIAPDGSTVYILDGTDNTVRRWIPGSLTQPQVTSQPAAQTVSSGQPAGFSVAGNGSPPLSYQWQRAPAGTSAWVNVAEGGAFSGSATAQLSLSDVTVALDGTQFRCVLSNNAASTSSSVAPLLVLGPPSINAAPQTQALRAGSSVTLDASATGRALSFQWFLNNVAIAGATGASLTIGNLQTGVAGAYSVTVSNSFGAASSTIDTLSVASARLINLSASGFVGSTGHVLASGFVIGGSGSKNVLLRGAGPSLGGFGISGFLPQPILTLFDSRSAPLAANTGWGGVPLLAGTFTQVYAFPFAAAPPSLDSALLETLVAGTYSTQVSGGQNTTGIALNEIFDADADPNSAARLVNISASAPVGPGVPLVAGFVIGGNGTEKMLIRGVGPALSGFGVPAVLAAPVLTVFDSNRNVVGTNQGWGNDALISAAASAVSAFPLPAGSSDCALLLTLPAGSSYTAQVTGAGGSNGTALVEIYEDLK